MVHFDGNPAKENFEFKIPKEVVKKAEPGWIPTWLHPLTEAAETTETWAVRNWDDGFSAT